MTKVALTGGAYEARSLIASAQRCVNLFAEQNPGDAPFPFTYYPTPGLTRLASPSPAVPTRLEYVTSTGQYYRVLGASVYAVGADWSHVKIGTVADGTTPCSMADNGVVAVLVDGTSSGYAIDLSTGSFGAIDSPAFYGADYVGYLDAVFAFNKPGSGSWYISGLSVTYTDLTTPMAGTVTGGSGYVNGTHYGVHLTGGSGSGAVATVTISGGAVTAVTVTDPGLDYASTDVLTATAASLGGSGSGFEYALTTAGAFNSTDIAVPTGSAGDIVTICVVRRYVWIFKPNGTEVWYDTGSTDFLFGPTPGLLIDHGCVAKYSVATYDGTVFWLGRDKAGQGIVFAGSGSEAKRVSTHALEVAIQAYGDLSDAVGYVYQQDGHTFYVLSFPAGDATWVYDLATGFWHERVWLDQNGDEHRHRGALGAFAYGSNVCGDWQTGALYLLDQSEDTDDGQTVVCCRGFPHILEDGDRVQYRQFMAEMASGTTPGEMATEDPQVSLRWSDSRGFSWGSPVTAGIGSSGQYSRCVQWQRLGMARDRVFELFWNRKAKTCLSGAFIEWKRLGT